MRARGLLLVSAFVLGLSGCDFGTVPAAQRPSPTRSPMPEYLGDDDLERLYRYSDAMIAASKAITEARIERCGQIDGATRSVARTRCWDELVTPFALAMSAFGTAASGMHHPELSERCDKALSRITSQAHEAGDALDAFVDWTASPVVEGREDAVEYAYDVLAEAEEGVDRTYTRFERHCLDPADRGEGSA